MNVAKIYNNPTQFQAITSLTPGEFDLLLPSFVRFWRKWYKHYDFRLKRRRKPLSATAAQGNTRTLSSDEDKLFFILYIFKNNPLQQLAAATFEMDQGQVSKWIKILMPILADAIKDLHLQPARDMDELIRLFRQRSTLANEEEEEEVEIQTLKLDATERPIGRNTDYEAQKHDYSGKQKQHTVKNSVMCDEYQFVHFLGYTWRGAIHDKAMAQEELPNFEAAEMEHIWLAKDTGYQAFCPQGIILLEPFKARRGHPLTKIQKQINTWISSIRVGVEHAIGGIKKLRLVSEKWRSKVSSQIDLAILVATGLHNLRVTCRTTSYTQIHARSRERLQIFHS